MPFISAQTKAIGSPVRIHHAVVKLGTQLSSLQFDWRPRVDSIAPQMSILNFFRLLSPPSPKNIDDRRFAFTRTPKLKQREREWEKERDSIRRHRLWRVRTQLVSWWRPTDPHGALETWPHWVARLFPNHPQSLSLSLHCHWHQSIGYCFILVDNGRVA